MYVCANLLSLPTLYNTPQPQPVISVTLSTSSAVTPSTQEILCTSWHVRISFTFSQLIFSVA